MAYGVDSVSGATDVMRHVPLTIFVLHFLQLARPVLSHYMNMCMMLLYEQYIEREESSKFIGR